MLAAAKLTRQVWRRVTPASAASVRGFRGTSSDGAWRNETPAGSSTEVFVYSPELDISWPNQKLGVLASKDKNFVLPGDIGTCSPESLTIPAPGAINPTPDVLSSPNNQERQVHALYNANDFIRFTKGSSKDVFSDGKRWLWEFPELPELEEMDMEVHSVPQLLKKDLAAMFPHEPSTASVITLSFYTQHDMSVWSQEMEEERERLTHSSILHCKEICGRLKEEDYWADFIDPCSGTPHFSPHTNNTLFETDERYRSLGFRIDDLGCCKVIEHKKFGRYVFVATIVTNANPNSDVLEDLLEELNPDWGM